MHYRVWYARLWPEQTILIVVDEGGSQEQQILLDVLEQRIGDAGVANVEVG